MLFLFSCVSVIVFVLARRLVIVHTFVLQWLRPALFTFDMSDDRQPGFDPAAYGLSDTFRLTSFAGLKG